MSDEVTRRSILATSGATIVAATAGCVGSERDETETIEETFDVDDVSRLTIDGHSEVTVGTEDRDDVAVVGEKRAAREGGLDGVDLAVDRTDDALAVAIERDGGILGGLLGPGPTMGLSVRVPRSLQVERVGTTNGPTEVTGVRGGVSVQATNGAITLSDVRGNVDVEGVNGDVLVSGVAGDLVVETTNGGIEADSIDGDVDVETTNGAVTLVVAPDLDATIDVQTDNGSVTITGVGDLSGAEDFPVTVGDGRRSIDVETANGDVTLRASE